jgi:hypothetical protein
MADLTAAERAVIASVRRQCGEGQEATPLITILDCPELGIDEVTDAIASLERRGVLSQEPR